MKHSTSIDIDLTGIGRILLNTSVAVPIYQRAYAWEDEQVRDLCTDIETAMRDGAHEYFIGCIVTTTKDGRTEIADGQQRLATVTILLAAIRDYLYRSGDTQRAQSITEKYLYQLDLHSLEKQPRLELNAADNDYFRRRVLSLPDEPDRAAATQKPSHCRIDRAAQLAEEHIARLTVRDPDPLAMVRLVDYLLDSVKAIWVKVPDETNAFMIFETLNDRGLALSITDLLKNYLFGLADKRLAEVQNSWTAMTGTIEAMEEGTSVLTFLRHYWSSQKGLVREKELYKDIQKGIRTADSAVDFARQLEASAATYAAIVTPGTAFWAKYGDSSRRHMATLNELRMIQIRPLLLSILAEFDVAQARKAMKQLVSWSVRFLVHGGLGSGTIETHSCSAAKEIRDGAIRTAPELYKRLASVIPTDTQFRQAFLTATVSKAFLARYYLRALEQQRGGAAEPELVPNEDRDAVNLEHVLPLKASTPWSHISADEQAALVNRLGNLALLATRLNSTVGNDGFDAKRPYFAQSAFTLTKSIADEVNWDRSAIDRRQKELSELAVKAWPLR